MEVRIKDLKKAFGEWPVLRNLSMDIRQGEFLSVVGPSGAGKTTLLRIIAGLDSSDGGEITWLPEKETWSPVIMVFQDFLLFPQLTVNQNIAYGLHNRSNFARRFPSFAENRSRKARAHAISKEVADHITHFGLEGLQKKYPRQLSAGQRQRVALARAMILKPSLLLLDEPFANLDQNLKMETALFIRNIQEEYGVTTLAVTHDLPEAFAMSDRIAVLLDGEIGQQADVETLYRFPADHRVGNFLGPVNIIPRNYIKYCSFDGKTPVELDILVRAEAIDLLPSENGPAFITSRRFQGSLIRMNIDLNGLPLEVFRLNCNLQPGQRVQVKIYDHVYVDQEGASDAPGDTLNDNQKKTSASGGKE